MSKVLIEQNKRFSKSCLWELQREYFEKEGINAWVSQVPFFVTSNPFIANCYAMLVIHFIRDWVNKHPESKQHPFYVMELGTGSGQFSFFVLKRIQELRRELKMDDVHVCYIMSDFTESNIIYWEAHPALQPYLQDGSLDFAIYNMENEDPITLHRQKFVLTPDRFVNPLCVFANYIFDTISHDIFRVSRGRISEVLVSLTTDRDNLADGKPIDWEKVSIDYEPREIRGNYYSDPNLNSVVFEYQHLLQDSSFLFPIGGLLAIKKLKQLTNDKIFLISSDKGYSDLPSMDNLGYPSLAFHGSFSMMVNFHAIAQYFKHTGGDYFLQTSRKGIRTGVFFSGFKLSDLPETTYATNILVEGISPADYFILHRRMSDSFQECSLDTIASHLAFSGWDPYILHKLNARICNQNQVDEADPATIEYLAAKMPKFEENFYAMPKSDNTLFEIAVFYHMAKLYDKAAEYYKKSEPYCTDGKFGLFYNLALCLFHRGEHQEALANFKKAHELEPDSKEVSEWISHLELLPSEGVISDEAEKRE